VSARPIDIVLARGPARFDSLRARAAARRSRALLCMSLALATSACELMLGGIPPDPLDEDAGSAMGADASASAPELVRDAGDSTPNDGSSGPDGGIGHDPPATDAPDPSEHCGAATRWYADHDRDGYGAGESVSACDRPQGAWSAAAGDCDDDDPRVHPGQAAFFGQPYTRADGSTSFDYDCSGSEQGDPSLQVAPRCEELMVPRCGGSGYLATSRSGPALNPYCGSTLVETCVPSVAVVLCTPGAKDTSAPPYTCR
jgi:hypothetical protein